MHLVAKDSSEPFKGYALIQAFAQNGLHASENQHFQRFASAKGDGELWFHVASMRHPGVFDLSDPGMMSCPGLVLILDCKQVEDVVEAFDAMLDTAHRLAADLDGNLLDDSKQPLATDTTKSWREQRERQSAVVRSLSKLLWLLVLVSVVRGIDVADINDLLDTDIHKQKMVMGKAGLGNVAPEPVPVVKKQPAPNVEDKADRLVARVENKLSFPAQKIHQWAAQVAQELIYVVTSCA